MKYLKTVSSIDGTRISKSPDSQSFLLVRESGARLWDRSGELLLDVKVSEDHYRPIATIGDDHFYAKQNDRIYIYDFKGQLFGDVPNSFDHKMSSNAFRVVCTKFGEPNTVWVYAKGGNLIKTFYLAEYDSQWGETGVYEHYILSHQDEIIINDANGVSLYDLDGKLLKKRPGLCHNVHSLGNGMLLLEKLNGQLVAWNFKTSAEMISTEAFKIGALKRNDTLYGGSVSPLRETDWIEIREASRRLNSILWNYKTGKTIRTGLELLQYSWVELPGNLIEGYDHKTSTFHLYDLHQQKSFFSLSNYQFPHHDGSYHQVHFSEDKEHFILTNYQLCRLYTKSGDLVKDFKAIDSSIHDVNFINGGNVGAVNEDGIFRIWDLTGEELDNGKLTGSDFVHGLAQDHFIWTRDRSTWFLRVYGYDGTLSASQWGFQHMLSKEEMVIIEHNGKGNYQCELRKLFELDKGVYQLSLKADQKEFYTYIYLTQSQKEAIEQYKQARLVRFNAEKDRQKVEARVVRRFTIKKFGIYNYDRFVNDDSRIHLAASFDFGQAIDFNNITVFLITDFNGPSVVKFYKSSWEKFSFDPSKPNRLLAVLPDDKVAYFSQADFDKLDLDVIKQSKSYKFDMKISEEPIARLMDLEKMLQ